MENKVLTMVDRFVGKFAATNTLVNRIVDYVVPQANAQAASCPSGTVMCWSECVNVRCSHYDTALRYDCGPSWSECLFGNFRQYTACNC